MSHRHTPSADEVLSDPILRAAYDAVLDLGVRRTTLSEVARRAGVSRMTVYRRYDDLDRLLASLLTAELGAVVADVARGTERLPTARARLVAAVDQVTRRTAAHPLLRRILDVDPESLLPLVVDRFGSSQRAATHLLAARLAAGMAARGGDGSVRDADPDVLALALVTVAQSFVFSAGALASTGCGAAVADELPRLVDGFLAPEVTP